MLCHPWIALVYNSCGSGELVVVTITFIALEVGVHTGVETHDIAFGEISPLELLSQVEPEMVSDDIAVLIFNVLQQDGGIIPIAFRSPPPPCRFPPLTLERSAEALPVTVDRC